MTKDEMLAKFREVNAWVPGKRIKLDFGDQGVVMMDGVDHRVTEADDAADTTIRMSWADWTALTRGELNPMAAFMSGKLKLDGDMAGAMQLQGVLGKLSG